MQNASSYRLLRVQINSHLVYMEPLGKTLLFPQIKQNSSRQTYLVNPETPGINIKNNIAPEKMLSPSYFLNASGLTECKEVSLH